MWHHTGLIFVFLVETGFHHVGQASLQLLDSSYLPASDSQNDGITGVSYHAQALPDFYAKSASTEIVRICSLNELYGPSQITCDNPVFIYLFIFGDKIWLYHPG